MAVRLQWLVYPADSQSGDHSRNRLNPLCGFVQDEVGVGPENGRFLGEARARMLSIATEDDVRCENSSIGFG